MAAQTAAPRTLASARWLYAVFALLLVGPIIAVGAGAIGSQSFSLSGPGGPLLAYCAGVVSFTSPCVLPLVPIYITHISGASIQAGRVTASRRTTFSHALAFITGLSVVFIALGASLGLLGSYFLTDHQRELEHVAGVMLVLMGILLLPELAKRNPRRQALAILALTLAFVVLAELNQVRDDRRALLELTSALALVWLRFAGFLPFRFFQRTFEVDLAKNRTTGYTRSALVGGSFALGWTPCIGPILGSILTVAATSDQALTGLYLLVAYSAGLSIPFLITGLALSDAQAFFRKIQPYTPVIEVVSAAMLVALGSLLWFGRLSSLSQYFTDLGGTPKI